MSEFSFVLLMVAFLIGTIILFANLFAKVINSALEPIEYGTSQTAFSYTSSNGKTYYLHLDEKITKSGKVNRLHFFGLRQMDNAVAELPNGYTVAERANGVPLLKLAV